jgi:hypothetical protein
MVSPQVSAVLLVGAALMAAVPAWGQQRARPPDSDVEELTPGQIQRAQEPQFPRQPSAKSEPRPTAPKAAAPRAVACSGVFAKDSSHLKLATVFDSQNVTFTEVDGPDGTKLRATVLFPRDPKRRLEVLWENEAARMGTSLIVINGQSAWSAPKGLRLGLALAALERLNGKPFRLRAFDKDGIASVSDWQGGALDSLPGGCKVGVNFKPDPKAAPEARAEASGDKEFASSDAAIKAARPVVAEILVGY